MEETVWFNSWCRRKSF